MINFSDLQLSDDLCQTVTDMNYNEPSEIQRSIIPLILNRENIQISAHYGNGKTAAFLLPLIDLLGDHQHLGFRALILVPSANYAHKVKSNLSLLAKNRDLKYVNLNDYRDKEMNAGLLQDGVDIIIGTPNTICELIDVQNLNLTMCEYLIVDESDLYNELNYYSDLEHIKQHLPELISVAMFHGEETEFTTLVSQLFMTEVKKLVFYEDEIKVQEIVYISGSMKSKIDSLTLHLQQSRYRNVIVYVNSFKVAEDVFFKLRKHYNHKIAFLNKKRMEIKDKLLRLLFDGKVQILIICADDFGDTLQLHGINQVINFDLPNDSESYHNRKSGLRGINKNSVFVSFCGEHEKETLDQIEKDSETQIDRYYFNDIGVKELYAGKTQSENFDYGRYSKDRNRY